MMKWLDRLALAGMGTGIALVLWPPAFKAGFFITLAFTILHIVTSHVALNEQDEEENA